MIPATLAFHDIELNFIAFLVLLDGSVVKKTSGPGHAL
jgi:hypothetical protein